MANRTLSFFSSSSIASLKSCSILIALIWFILGLILSYHELNALESSVESMARVSTFGSSSFSSPITCVRDSYLSIAFNSLFNASSIRKTIGTPCFLARPFNRSRRAIGSSIVVFLTDSSRYRFGLGNSLSHSLPVLKTLLSLQVSMLVYLYNKVEFIQLSSISCILYCLIYKEIGVIIYFFVAQLDLCAIFEWRG